MPAAAWTSWRLPGAVNDISAQWTPDAGSDLDCVIVSDNVYTRSAAVGSANGFACHTFGFSAEIPAGSTINGVEFRWEASCGTTLDPYTYHVGLTKTANDTIVGTEKTGSLSGAADGTRTIGGIADLWGTTLSAAEVRDTTFGAHQYYTDNGASRTVRVDLVEMRVNYTAPVANGEEEEETMDLFRAGAEGGVECLLHEALPACSSSTAIFANAPAGTIWVEFIFYGQAVHISWDGDTATTSAGGGIKYPVDTVFRRPLTSVSGDSVKAIQAAATATGDIAYWGKSN